MILLPQDRKFIPAIFFQRQDGPSSVYYGDDVDSSPGDIRLNTGQHQQQLPAQSSLPDLLSSNQPQASGSWSAANSLLADDNWPPPDMTGGPYNPEDLPLFADLDDIDLAELEPSLTTAGGEAADGLLPPFDTIMTDDATRRLRPVCGYRGASGQHSLLLGRRLAPAEQRQTAARRAAAATSVTSDPAAQGSVLWAVASYTLIPLACVLVYSQTAEFPALSDLVRFILHGLVLVGLVVIGLICFGIVRSVGENGSTGTQLSGNSFRRIVGCSFIIGAMAYVAMQ